MRFPHTHKKSFVYDSSFASSLCAESRAVDTTSSPGTSWHMVDEVWYTGGNTKQDKEKNPSGRRSVSVCFPVKSNNIPRSKQMNYSKLCEKLFINTSFWASWYILKLWVTARTDDHKKGDTYTQALVHNCSEEEISHDKKLPAACLIIESATL